MTNRKSVRFSDLVRYSDNRIRYLEFEDDDDIRSTCSNDSKLENMKPQFPPSPPTNRRSLLNEGSRHPLDPPSLRRRPILDTISKAECTVSPIRPQRRGTIEPNFDLNLEKMTRAEDYSIHCSKSQDPADISGRSWDSMMPRAVKLARKTNWCNMMSGGAHDRSPPAMPKRQLSGNSVDVLSTPPTSPRSAYGDCSLSSYCNAQWKCDALHRLNSLPSNRYLETNRLEYT